MNNKSTVKTGKRRAFSDGNEASEVGEGQAAVQTNKNHRTGVICWNIIKGVRCWHVPRILGKGSHTSTWFAVNMQNKANCSLN